MTSDADIRGWLVDYLDRVWNRHDLTAIDDYVPPTFRLDTAHHRRLTRAAGGGVPWDRGGLRLAVQTVLSAHRSYRVDLVRLVVQAPRALFVHETHGLTAGPAPRPLSYRGACLYTFDGHWIVARRGAMDAAHYLRQVGVDRVPDLPAVPV